MHSDLSSRLADRFTDTTVCAFCCERKTLKVSHILPAFVFRWLKDTSGTPYLRSTQNPNRRVQDGEKEKLLCSECESLFNEYETSFCNRIFYPIVAGTLGRVSYSAWFSRFLASVSWRVLALHLRRGVAERLTQRKCEAVENALQTWERFLKKEVKSPGAFEQHVLPMGKLKETTDTDIPTNINRYMQRGVEMDLIYSDQSDLLLTYAKMGPIALFGHISPPSSKWLGTRISVNNGIFPPNKIELPMNIWTYLSERSRKQQLIFKSLSLNQRQKIDTEFEKNIERFRSSDQFRTMLDDYDMFGPGALIRKG